MDGMCADAMYVRGLCLYYQDNMEKAFQHFQQVLRLAPDHSKARDVYRVSNNRSLTDIVMLYDVAAAAAASTYLLSLIHI